MNFPSLSGRFPTLAFSLAVCTTAGAHISYTNRNFGSFSGGEAPVSIVNRSVPGLYSWASGTDANYGWSELVRAYRFNLTYNASVSIDVSATSNNGALLGDLFPAFSLYSGLAHTTAGQLDHDEAPVSVAWRGPGLDPPTGGNFRALGDWKVGNDAGLTEADLSSFTYIGHAADGTAANYGAAAGINGDGLANGRVVATFNLGPGDYTIFVGGANLGAQAADDRTLRGVDMTLTVVPEPAAAGLLLSGITGLLLRRRRR